MAQEPRSTLGRDDWTTAALAAIAEGGTRAVAIEALARELGATKGSFYWHFRTRDALLEAALARWEEVDAWQIDERAAIPDPRARLKDLFAGVIRDAGEVEASLLADARWPTVAAARARVTARRLEATTKTLPSWGSAARLPATARSRVQRLSRALRGRAGGSGRRPEPARRSARSSRTSSIS